MVGSVTDNPRATHAPKNVLLKKKNQHDLNRLEIHSPIGARIGQSSGTDSPYTYHTHQLDIQGVVIWSTVLVGRKRALQITSAFYIVFTLN